MNIRAKMKVSASKVPQLPLYDTLVKEFISIIKNKIVTSNESDVFIFIHGYNVSFDEAVKRTAQIAFDLSFSGVPITYSWPSKGSVNGYLSDEDSVLWTTPNLKEFLKLILSNNDLKRCHLIAHSMGNRAVTNALRELNLEKIDLSKINQIILAAPDIDSQVFSDVIFPGIKGIGENITLYASSRDKALKMSRWLRDGILRIGESGENLVIVDGIDTIDASHIDTNFLGHGYFAETKELLYDLHMVLNLYLSPDQRKLKRISSHPKGDYWQFI